MKNINFIKKSVSLLLTLFLALSVFTACSDSPKGEEGSNVEKEEIENDNDSKGKEKEQLSELSEGSEDSEGSFKIGVPWDTASTDPTWNSVYSHIKLVVEAAGGEVVNVDTDLTAETLIDNIEELISRDVDGILFMQASDTMLPTVDSMCSDAGVYWGTFFRNISDEDIKEAIYSSEYFAGGCFEDDEECVINLMSSMSEMGVTDVGVINIAKGDASSDLRDKGAEIGAERSNINILNTSYNMETTNDITRTMESYIAAYPEMNGVIVLGTYAPAAIPTIIKVIEDQGKTGDIKVGRIDFEVAMAEQMAEGTFHVSYGGQQQIDPMMSAVILVNKVMGTPIVEDGPTIIVTPYLPLTSAEEAEQYNQYFMGDEFIYYPEEIQELMIRKDDPEHKMNLDYFNDLIDTFSIADVVERHAK